MNKQDYPNITFARAIHLLAQLGYTKKDKKLEINNKLITGQAKYEIANRPMEEWMAGAEKTNEHVYFIDKYFDVLNSKETKAKYSVMEKNKEFELVDKVYSKIISEMAVAKENYDFSKTLNDATTTKTPKGKESATSNDDSGHVI